ncbi:hypothetical protein [Streptomyces sp. SLBN-118]|uniref:hypothetical protein n=1 Tax=Streptomyces sp. SLBN-118 TaxID=2768454 RepID=UPI0037DA1647
MVTLGAADSGAAEHRAAAALRTYDHVVVVVFENKQYGEIIGSPAPHRASPGTAATRPSR